MSSSTRSFTPGTTVVACEIEIALPSIGGVLTPMERRSDTVLYGEIMGEAPVEDPDDPPVDPFWLVKVWSDAGDDGEVRHLSDDEIFAELPREMFDAAREAGWPSKGVPGLFSFDRPVAH